MKKNKYIIIHNPRCRKSREALNALEEAGVNPDIRLYLLDQLSASELSIIIDKLGLKPEQIIRKSEKVYKENFKGKKLSDKELIEVMVKFPKLIQRPIIIKGNYAVIARSPEAISKIIS
jgi:arsenate reductase